MNITFGLQIGGLVFLILQNFWNGIAYLKEGSHPRIMANMYTKGVFFTCGCSIFIETIMFFTRVK